MKKYGFKHDESIVVFAATFINVEWARVIGSGKARPFHYTGKHFKAFTGRTFCSLYHFLIKVQLQVRFKLIRSRLKQKWPLDRALLEEKREANRNAGSVYCLTCNPSQKRYVGITCGSINSRFKEHVREASTNSTRLIASEIRQFGAESFGVKPLALNVPIDSLGELERVYIAKLNTLRPFGLNANRGGQVSYTAGKQIKIEGETFESITIASEIISAKTEGAVPAYIIESRIRSGKVKLGELIKPCRRASKHSEAGTPLFRRHKDLLKRKTLDERWKVYDLFKADVLENISFKDVEAKRLVLAKKDSNQPYSKQNFEWVSKLEVTVKRCGKKCVVDGHLYASVEAVARFFEIPASSLRYEIKNSSKSVEGAVFAILERRTKITRSK
ncbi:GIY-YIG nuclease family protein [Alteromonas sp. CI.11.F.A3]|uniref:GIY-YIG nuclease family protein n=1 Tax=Alteromonas sp. CI.11.F.A3 TaxID=3079555 RepID=UPI002942D49B|nr:GIY-YIG nuclease family protein [Alteromonas sp. CI.11.F.A3]WOI39326.1 GIY-YIG nuclease family protein [Alteromonas sp. CI.11.F.A3]